jgi:hypothetical protein
MARRTRTKRKKEREGRDVNDDAVLLGIIADVRRLERHRETELQRRMRHVEKLSTARKPENARQLAQALRRVHAAQLECADVVGLRRDIERIVRTARARLAALESEVAVDMNAAMARYVAASAARGATAELNTARLPRPRNFATALAKAKHATAIAIADRNKMQDAVASLAADAERAAEADEWRRELAVQEATVAHLKEGLRLLVAKGVSR